MKILILIFVFTPFCFAQKPCNFDAPEIRGLKLGMPKKEVLEILPSDRKVIIPNSDFYSVNPSNTKNFEHIDSISTRFFEDKLYHFEIVYKNNAVSWDSSEQFAKNLSANLKIPFDFWFFKSSFVAQIKCPNFFIEITAPTNRIVIEDLTAEEKKKKIEEEKRKNFKP